MNRLILSAALSFFVAVSAFAAEHPLTPRISSEWWTVAGDPDLGELTTPKQQPVDFGIWQASDGSWQLWSCIRGTNEPGKTRLLYRWEGAKITDANWTPRGIAMQADVKLGETQGGLQAPYVMKHEGKYWMFYGDWANICLATSSDGKTFARAQNIYGRPQLSVRGEVDQKRNTRDAMVLHVWGKWHLYYTAH